MSDLTSEQSRAELVARLRPWLIRLAVVLPLVAIVAAAVPRLITGLALEAAFPDTAYIGMNVPQTKVTYEKTAAVLSKASLADGETQIIRAEAASLAGEPARTTVPILEAGLAQAPASGRGWMLLAQVLGRSDSARAAASVTISFEIAPHERFLFLPQIFAAAPVWQSLPQTVQGTVLLKTRSLLARPRSDDYIHYLLELPGGPQLLTRVFNADPDTVRDFNRKMASQRLGLKAPPSGH